MRVFFDYLLLLTGSALIAICLAYEVWEGVLYGAACMLLGYSGHILEKISK